MGIFGVGLWRSFTFSHCNLHNREFILIVWKGGSRSFLNSINDQLYRKITLLFTLFSKVFLLQDLVQICTSTRAIEIFGTFQLSHKLYKMRCVRFLENFAWFVFLLTPSWWSTFCFFSDELQMSFSARSAALQTRKKRNSTKIYVPKKLFHIKYFNLTVTLIWWTYMLKYMLKFNQKDSRKIYLCDPDMYFKIIGLDIIWT